MGESNNEWGNLESDESREAWDSYARIPEPGENRALDSFIQAKRIDHASLVRLGARLSAPSTLAFAFEGGIKFRNVITGKRYSWPGATFGALKIIPGKDRTTVIVCEGESDAARLTILYDVDVAVMPAGAKAWKPRYTDQVTTYEKVLVGLDNDEAGEAGWHKIREAVPRSIRFGPPAVLDWCELEDDPPPLPDAAEGPSSVLVCAKELLTLDVPDHASWLDGAVLPVGGSAVIHGTFKSFKTWIALDLASALAQMLPWATFAPTEEPARVAYINFEVPWAYYKERVARFATAAKHPDLFGENFLSYSPLSRPRLVAGNVDSENTMIRNLQKGTADIVIIDPVRRAMGYADMNAENEVRRMLHFADRLQGEGMTVVMLHHDNKEADRHGGGDPSGMTGSGAWAGDVDTIVSIERPPNSDRLSTRRNLKFLLRNAPSPGPKGFELTAEGRVVWHEESWVESETTEAQEPKL